MCLVAVQYLFVRLFIKFLELLYYKHIYSQEDVIKFKLMVMTVTRAYQQLEETECSDLHFILFYFLIIFVCLKV